MKAILAVLILMYSCDKSLGDQSFVWSIGNLAGYLQNEPAFTKFPVEPKMSYTTTDAMDTPAVNTTSGMVVGSTLEEAHAFFSVPFATPPVGDLRFRDPKPIERRSGIINATTPDLVACRQLPHDECSAGYCMTYQKEDCLVLNVHVPRSIDLAEAGEYKLPILFWIHGGAFFEGSGTTPKYDGRHLSNVTGTIVVSTNYRVGAYGFLVYNKGDDQLEGNQGLKDQQLALKWVQDNIANFGGDKDQVTIFGESAGAQSVMFHMLSKISKPLFRRAIFESNPAVFPHQTPEEAMSVTNRLLTRLNCSGENEFECLLLAPAEELDHFPAIMLQSALDGDGFSAIEPYRPVIDGQEFTDQPLTLFQEGKWNTEKEFVIGANTQETEIIQFYVPGRKLQRVTYRQLNKLFLGDDIGTKVSDYYEETIGPDEDGDYSKLLGVEGTDAFFVCPSRAMARLAYDTAESPESIHFYMFDHAPDGEYCREIYPKNETCGYVYHSAELTYVFRTGPDFGYIFSEDELKVTNQFSEYWGNFAKSGNPNGENDNSVYLEWRPYTKTSSWPNIRIKPSSYEENEYNKVRCDFWDSLNFYVEFPATATTPRTTSKNTTAAEMTNQPTTLEAEMTTSSSNVLRSFNFLIILCIYSSLINV